MTSTKGKDLALYIDDNLVALAKNCNIDATGDLVEVSNILSGRAKKYIAGRYGWQITSESLVSADNAGFLSFLAKLKEGARVAVAFTTPESPRLAGYAFVQSLSESGAIGSMATYKVTLVGDGSLSVG